MIRMSGTSSRDRMTAAQSQAVPGKLGSGDRLGAGAPDQHLGGTECQLCCGDCGFWLECRLSQLLGPRSVLFGSAMGVSRSTAFSRDCCQADLGCRELICFGLDVDTKHCKADSHSKTSRQGLAALVQSCASQFSQP